MITLLLHLLRLLRFLLASHREHRYVRRAAQSNTPPTGLHRHQGTPPLLRSFFLATARKPDGLRIPVALPPTRLGVLPVDLKLLPSESDEVLAKHTPNIRRPQA